MKKILKIVMVLVFVMIAFVIYKASSFSLLDGDNSVLLEEIEVSKGYSLKIYFSPSDATIQEAIVVMKFENGKEETVEVFEKYNTLTSYKLIRNDSLELIMRNTRFKDDKNYRVLVALPN